MREREREKIKWEGRKYNINNNALLPSWKFELTNGKWILSMNINLFISLEALVSVRTGVSSISHSHSLSLFLLPLLLGRPHTILRSLQMKRERGFKSLLDDPRR